MKTYKIALTRTYIVTIKAENEYKAKRFSEFYIGDCVDLSKQEEKVKRKFNIDEIEMVYNEANETISISD